MSTSAAYPVPSSDECCHVHADGKPAYRARFTRVGKFHEPGLAPAQDPAGWFHIRPDGNAAYPYRYEMLWGFYCGLAAAKDKDGWMHVDSSGAPAYAERFAWVGNYQAGLCAVQTTAGFFHIDLSGRKAYELTHAYVGDFRDGVAVATSDVDGLCRHIRKDGTLLHSHAFEDLDVFHKGYARAKDARGWHHVDARGQACYIERYAAVEPFYNGLARVDAFNGLRLRIDPKGIAVDRFEGGQAANNAAFHLVSADVVGYWKSLAIACAVQAGLFEALPGRPESLSAKISAPVDMTLRLLRATSELGLTVQGQDGVWTNTNKGQLLMRSHPTSLAYSALEMAGPHIARWQQLLMAIRGSGNHCDVFEEAAASPDRSGNLHLMMNAYALRDYDRAVSALVLPDKGVVLDAGGGLGALARKIHEANSGLEVFVLERPEVCRLASELGLDSAVKWVPGDFWGPWPMNADLITMARVLHDWDDKKCLGILKHAKACLRPGGTLVILETVLSARGWEGGLCDLHLLAVSGGKERTLEEFIRLGSEAGFRLTDVREASSLHHALHFIATP